jgi:hypothetical protein
LGWVLANAHAGIRHLWVDAERQKELAALDEFIRHPPPPVTEPDGSVTFQGPSLANLKARQVSVTKLIEEMATVLIADFDAETRFELRAAQGRGQLARGKALLDKARGKRTSAGTRTARR